MNNHVNKDEYKYVYAVVPLDDSAVLSLDCFNNITVLGLLKFNNVEEISLHYNKCDNTFKDVLMIANVVLNTKTKAHVLEKQNAHLFDKVKCAKFDEINIILNTADAVAIDQFFAEMYDDDYSIYPQLCVPDDDYPGAVSEWILHFQEHLDKSFETESELLAYIKENLRYEEIPTCAEHIQRYNIDWGN